MPELSVDESILAEETIGCWLEFVLLVLLLLFGIINDILDVFDGRNKTLFDGDELVELDIGFCGDEEGNCMINDIFFKYYPFME